MLGSSPAAAEPLNERTQQLVGLFNGTREPDELFSPAFLSQVPASQLKGISEQLRAQLGKAQSVQRLDRKSATSADAAIAFERGSAQLRLAIEAKAPHRIEGLLITGTEVRGDSFTRISEELKALPGRTSFAVSGLGEDAPATLAAHQAGEVLAIGSAFKLF